MFDFKRGLFYFLYVLGLWIFLYFGHLIEADLVIQTKNTFNPCTLFFFQTVFYVAVGVYLGLPKIFLYQNIKGKWKINKIKLISIGLPTFYIIFIAYLGSFTPLTHLPILFYPIKMFLGFPFFTMINGVILGFIILDSMYKANGNEYNTGEKSV